jgi:Taurine catabolism dioxygenase TauD, TfdA family
VHDVCPIAGREPPLSDATCAVVLPWTGGTALPAASPVLTGPDGRPAICVDFDDTRAGDPQAAQAFEALYDALWEVRQEFALAPGDMAIIDNTMALHGRTAFTPRYDGYDRWLQRLFTVRSLSDVVDLVAADSIFRCLPLLETCPPSGRHRPGRLRRRTRRARTRRWRPGRSWSPPFEAGQCGGG